MSNKYQYALDNVKIAPSFMGGNDEYRRHLDSAVPFLKDIATLQELIEKETPRKVLIKGTVIQCPKCFTIFPYVTGPLGPCVTSTEYCPECGQHLDWSDDND